MLNVGDYVFCTTNNTQQFDLTRPVLIFKEEEGITVILEKKVAVLGERCVLSIIPSQAYSPAAKGQLQTKAKIQQLTPQQLLKAGIENCV